MARLEQEQKEEQAQTGRMAGATTGQEAVPRRRLHINGQAVLQPGVEPRRLPMQKERRRADRRSKLGEWALRAFLGGDSPTEQLADFWGELSLLIATGVPLADALHAASRSLDSEWQEIYADAARSVATGVPLHQALAKWEAKLPPIVLPILQFGETMGTTQEAIRQLAEAFQRAAIVHQKFEYSAVNPGFAVPLMLLPTMLLIPLFIENMALYITYCLGCMGISISAWMLRHRIVSRQPRSHKKAKAKLKRTFYGLAQRNLAGARWARTLAVLWHCGVPISTALEVSARTTKNLHYETALQQAAERTRSGATLHESLAGTRLLPDRMLDIIRTGETAGDLGPALDRFADFMEDDAKMLAAQNFALRTFGPMLLLALVLAIVCLLFAWSVISIVQRMHPEWPRTLGDRIGLAASQPISSWNDDWIPG